MKAKGLHTKIVSITLSTPKGILELVDEEGRNGWELGALGSNFAFLQRERGADVPEWEYKVESITLSTPTGIQARLNELGHKGWAVAGVGPSFIFLKRVRGRTTHRRDYELASVTLLGINSIRKLIDERAAAGWGLVGLEKSFALFERLLERGVGSQTWEHIGLETTVASVTLRTPGSILKVVEEHAAKGWAVCAVTASFIFFRKMLPGSPATRLLAETHVLSGSNVRPKLPKDREIEEPAVAASAVRGRSTAGTVSRTASGRVIRGKSELADPLTMSKPRKIPSK